MTSEKLGPSFFEVFKISETTIFVRECLRLIRTLDSQHFRSIAVIKVFRPHPTISELRPTLSLELYRALAIKWDFAVFEIL